MSKDLQTISLKHDYPKYEYLINKIAEGENLDVEELIKKYLSPLKEYKKKRSRAKGVLNGYSVFLADKDIDKKIREENKDLSFGEISQIKGKMWKELPEKEKEDYKNLAKDKNNEKKNPKKDD